MRPPWIAMASGMRYVRIGPTTPTTLPSREPPRAATGVQPSGMKKAVMMPHAMKIAMLGMTMPERNVPNF